MSDSKFNNNIPISKMKSIEEKIMIIEVEKIVPGKIYMYNPSKLNEVKESIKMNGLYNCLKLFTYIDEETQESRYGIISGETRYRAIMELIEEGDTRFLKGIPTDVYISDVCDLGSKNL